MKTITIELPAHLHQKVGSGEPYQPNIRFELSSRHHEINGVQYDNPEKLHNMVQVPEFRGYMCHISAKSILITIFYDNDILKGI